MVHFKLFYIFLNYSILFAKQTQKKKRIGIHLYTIDMLFDLLVNTETSIILLHLDDSRRIIYKRMHFARDRNKQNLTKNKELSTQQSPL